MKLSSDKRYSRTTRQRRMTDLQVLGGYLVCQFDGSSAVAVILSLRLIVDNFGKNSKLILLPSALKMCVIYTVPVG